MRVRFRLALGLAVVASTVLGAGGPPTLEERLRALPPRGGSARLEVGGERIDLPGFQRFWRLELGRGTYVLVLDQQRGAHSLVLKLSPEEQLLGKLLVGAEIRSLLLCDLDWDGVDELVIDSLEGWGTGLLDRRLRVLRVEPELQELWQGCGDGLEAGRGEDLKTTVHLRCARPSDYGSDGQELELRRTIRFGSATATDGVRVALRAGRVSVQGLEPSSNQPGKPVPMPELCRWKVDPPARE